MNDTAPSSTPPASSSSTVAVDSAVAVARTHGASRFSDETYWTGHSVGAALLVIGVVLIVMGRGPRRREALDAIQADGTLTPSSLGRAREARPRTERIVFFYWQVLFAGGHGVYDHRRPPDHPQECTRRGSIR